MNYYKYFLIFILNLLIAIFILYKITQFALKWVDIYTKHDSYVVVPNLRYFTLSKSISILKKIGLKYNIIRVSRYNPNFKLNQVISFLPEAGDHVKEGRHIYIQVNSNNFLQKNKYTVLPNIINKDIKIAMKLLDDNHILIKDSKYVNDFLKNVVLKVFYKDKSIEYGYRLPINKKPEITLIIGKGYEKNNFITVPNVIGMSLHSAIQILKKKLFNIINFYYEYPMINSVVKNAKVYRQKPNFGEIYNKNKPIEIWLTSKEILDNLIQKTDKKEDKKEVKKEVKKEDKKE
ncbi:PASTA domain-containing protein, partial [Blattabacterium cuenoti]|uniref:PASTA domain-containing protein n=1 Tax=Blattabacterium cuenoti TaxID=1653831 RepID=UPI00163BCC46